MPQSYLKGVIEISSQFYFPPFMSQSPRVEERTREMWSLGNLRNLLQVLAILPEHSISRVQQVSRRELLAYYLFWTGDARRGFKLDHTQAAYSPSSIAFRAHPSVLLNFDPTLGYISRSVFIIIYSAVAHLPRQDMIQCEDQDRAAEVLVLLGTVCSRGFTGPRVFPLSFLF